MSLHSSGFVSLRLAALLSLVAVSSSTAWAQTIRVGPNIAVMDGSDRRPPVEPHLAIHPGNPRHLLGAAMTSVAEEETNT